MDALACVQERPLLIGTTSALAPKLHAITVSLPRKITSGTQRLFGLGAGDSQNTALFSEKNV